MIDYFRTHVGGEGKEEKMFSRGKILLLCLSL